MQAMFQTVKFGMNVVVYSIGFAVLAAVANHYIIPSIKNSTDLNERLERGAAVASEFSKQAASRIVVLGENVSRNVSFSLGVDASTCQESDAAF